MNRPSFSSCRYPEAFAEDGIVFIDDFLSQAECSAILDELNFALWQPSLTYQKQPNGSYVNVLTGFRLSSTAHQDWFSDDLTLMLKRIERKLRKHFGVDPANLEPWQATNYCRNGKFDYHLDSGYWTDHFAGERILTYLVYLTTPSKGGATQFRALDKSVPAKAGRLLVWNNLFANGDCNAKMIHSGMPVHGGRKTTLVTWQRQRQYRGAE
jgi:prolyl 4-hydroxylase